MKHFPLLVMLQLAVHAIKATKYPKFMGPLPDKMKVVLHVGLVSCTRSHLAEGWLQPNHERDGRWQGICQRWNFLSQASENLNTCYSVSGWSRNIGEFTHCQCRQSKASPPGLLKRQRQVPHLKFDPIFQHAIVDTTRGFALDHTVIRDLVAGRDVNRLDTQFHWRPRFQVLSYWVPAREVSEPA